MIHMSDEEFAALFQTIGSRALAKTIGKSQRTIQAHRDKVQDRLGIIITDNTRPESVKNYNARHPDLIAVDLPDGKILIGSDCHYWPGDPSTAHRAFVASIKHFKATKELQLVVLNGDVFDGAGISRHPPMGFSEIPTVAEEIEAVEERLGEIEAAAGKTRKIWTLGNHDARLAAKLAQTLPQFQGVVPLLSDRFTAWEHCMSVWVNGGELVIKHRHRGGVHSGYNNTLVSGTNIATGHTHILGATAFADYRGVRWGVSTGTMSHPDHPAFAYAEGGPKNWAAGFAVLTIRNGKLLWPELVHVTSENTVSFRGRTWTV